MTPELKARFDNEIKNNKIVIYMKGNPMFPQCGFSAAAVQALMPLGEIYPVDVLADSEVRNGIKEYSKWPTIPQIYINGQFVGGSDIIRELAQRGELEAMINGNGKANG